MKLTERKTRNEMIIRIDGKNRELVRQLIGELRTKYTANFAKFFKTITSVNDSEFAELVESITNGKRDIFFALPYTSRERVTNERAKRHNGLFPESKTIRYTEDWFNRLPRKIRG